MLRVLLALAVGVLPLFPAALRGEPLVHRLRDGDTKQLYWAINLQGVVYLSIRGRGGEGCARVFWRPIPAFGRTITLNDVCGNVRTQVPGASAWAVGGVLWARANHGDVAIILSSEELVAFDFPPVEIP